jgi:DNA topoisomerase-2
MGTGTDEPAPKRPKYEKLSPIEHVLTRPGMYTGGNDPTACTEWVLRGNVMSQEELTVSKGLLSVIGELLVNMRDASVLFPKESAKLSLKVENGWITATNTGKSHFIDVSEHPEHGVTNPELVFTNLHAGSNFGDGSEDRLTGGQNGLGAKLALIFSSEAVVEVGDPVRGKRFSQKVSGNMKTVGPAKIVSYKNKTGFVSVSIRPELHRFGLSGLDDEALKSVLHRRCVEIAASTPACVSTEYNGEKVGVKDFKAFTGLFGEKPALVHESERWKVAVFVANPGFQYSLVNGIHTRLGGSHVNHVLSRITSSALPKIQEKIPGAKASHVKENLGVVISCDITNPKFTSQTKEELSMPVAEFGSRFSPEEKEIQKVLSGPSGLVAVSLRGVTSKMDKAATKAQSNTTGKAHISVPKLDDATDAGTRNNQGTVLQVTEGDSAKVGQRCSHVFGKFQSERFSHVFAGGGAQGDGSARAQEVR